MSILDEYEKIVVLGGGIMAERIYAQIPNLKDRLIGVVDLLDDENRTINRFHGYDIISVSNYADFLTNGNIGIIVAIGNVCAADVCHEYIRKYANRTDNIIVPNPYTTLRFSFVDEDVSKETMLPKNHINYLKVRELLKDKESINIFNMIMDAKTYDGVNDLYELVKYDDIKDMYYYNEEYGFSMVECLKDEWGTVFDCGAYIGDSVKGICNEIKNKNILYYAFEPSNINYNEIVNNFGLRNNCTEFKAFNFGVGENNKIVDFMTPPSGDREGGHIVYNKIDSDATDISKCEIRMIDSLSLDIKGQLYIKMDIEGAELGALKGAINTIKTYRPIMSICVHHRKNDITEIPLFIKDLGVEYEYYLRGGYHTILLVIPK